MSAIGTRLLKIKIGATEYTAQVTKCVIAPVNADGPVTFAEAAAGGAKAWQLQFTALQDPDATTLWRTLWASAGSTVAVVVNPGGQTPATVAAPFFSGNAVVSQPDGPFIGGDADPSVSNRNTFDAVFTFTAKPTEVTTGAF
jgi:hypothetical protein